MNKLVLTVIFFVLYSTTYSQKFNISEIKPNAGLTLSTIPFTNEEGKDELDRNIGTGFRIGAEYFEPFSDKLELNIGTSITLLRTSIEEPEINYSLTYLGIHALARYTIIQNKLYLSAGPFLDYALTGSQEYKNSFYGDNEINPFKKQEGQNEAPLQRGNFGLDFKIGTNFNIDFIHEVYLSHRFGISNIEKADSKQSARTSVTSIGIIVNL